MNSIEAIEIYYGYWLDLFGAIANISTLFIFISLVFIILSADEVKIHVIQLKRFCILSCILLVVFFSVRSVALYSRAKKLCVAYERMPDIARSRLDHRISENGR
jgi:hypothetical protein